MPVIAVTGKDTLKINGRIITEQQSGDVAVLTHPNDISEVQTGKNGNSIYTHKYPGRQGELDIRVTLAGADDAFLNDLMNVYRNDPASFTLMTAEFTKNVGDGAVSTKAVNYFLTGGVFKKLVEAKENADGEPEQVNALYSLRFGNVVRSIG